MQTVAEKISNNILDLTEIDGNMSVFEKVEGTEWVLVSFVPTKTIYHDLERIRRSSESDFNIPQALITCSPFSFS